MKKKISHSNACAKLIISGEYSALYKQPAIVTNLEYYNTQCSIFITNEQNIKISYKNETIMDGLITQALSTKKNEKVAFSTPTFSEESKVFDFTQFKKLSKNDFKNLFVMDNKNFTLPLYTIYLLCKKLDLNITNIHIEIKSNIPFKCGLGSSASCIVAILRSMLSIYNKYQITDIEIIEITKEAECLVHGESSGIDILPIFYNKPIIFNANKNTPPKAISNTNIQQKNNYNLFLVFTGIPQIDTKQNIEYVKKLKKNKIFWDTLGHITTDIIDSISIKNDRIYIEPISYNTFIQAMKENHRLLLDLGVVPKYIQDFIENIESTNGAAKICGSGSIHGDKAGYILAFSSSEKILQSLCNKFKFTYRILYPVYTKGI